MLAGALCAVTTTLKFNFFVLKLPIRPPALVAKQAGSLAALFGNRLGLGVGTSPWPEDYELMGVPFAKRGKRMDECIEIIRGLTSGEYFEFHGEFYDIPKTKMTPGADRTDPDPHRRSRRRGAAPGGPLRRLDARRRPAARNSTDSSSGSTNSRGRGPHGTRSRSTSSRSTRYTLDGIKRLEDKGVTDVIVGFRIPYIMGQDTEPLDAKIRASRDVRREGDEQAVTGARQWSKRA